MIQNSIQIIVPILSLALGAFLQFIITKRLEDRRALNLLRDQAYVDYCRSITEYIHLTQNGYNLFEETKFRSNIVETKTRICLYGSNNVIQAYDKFSSIGENLESKEQKESFSELLCQMRLDSASSRNNKIGPEILKRILLGRK